MGRDIEIRAATCWDAEQLAATMRPEDAAECEALEGYTPIEALLVSMRQSGGAGALLLGGELAAMFGVLEVPPATLIGPSTGYVWVLTGTAVDRHRRGFWEASRYVLAFYAERFEFLTNLVDGRYGASLRWLQRLGFVVHPPVHVGPQRRPFHSVTYRSTTWA